MPFTNVSRDLLRPSSVESNCRALPRVFAALATSRCCSRTMSSNDVADAVALAEELDFAGPSDIIHAPLGAAPVSPML
eukprot:5307346-Heterocapsa_arctica.AAC.1